jgi:hypothetical protein
MKTLYLTLALGFFVVYTGDMSHVALTGALISTFLYLEQTMTTRLPPPLLIRRERRIADYDIISFQCKFGFQQEDAASLLSCLFGDEIQYIRCDNGTSCHIEEAFLIMLYRMTSYEKFTRMQHEFGIEYTQLSRIFKCTIALLVERNHYLLTDNLDYFVERFGEYNLAIRSKIGEANMVQIALDTALFGDGKSLWISRPGQFQHQVYNGDLRVHCLQFMGVTAPDGMIVDFYGPCPGNTHDDFDVYVESNFNQRLADAQTGRPEQYKVYMDKGYENMTHTWGLLGAELPINLQNENRLMTAIRTGVEWAFGAISQRMVINCVFLFL